MIVSHIWNLIGFFYHYKNYRELSQKQFLQWFIANMTETLELGYLNNKMFNRN